MKVQIGELWEPAMHYNPATGRDELIWRKRHNTVTSPRLKALDRCVADQMRDRRYRGHGASEDQREVRQALAEIARSCAKKGRNA